jgi:hypothetical protein
LRGGLADQPPQRLSQGADGLLSKARLPPFFDDAEQLTICILGLSTLRGEASDLRPTAGPLSLDHGNALLPKHAHRHADRLLRYARQKRKVSNPHPRLIEDPHDVGADGEREVRFALELDCEGQQ